jgi:hypothetical protein
VSTRRAAVMGWAGLVSVKTPFGEVVFRQVAQGPRSWSAATILAPTSSIRFGESVRSRQRKSDYFDETRLNKIAEALKAVVDPKDRERKEFIRITIMQCARGKIRVA